MQALSYHAPMENYVLGVVEEQEFELPKDDEIHRNWAKEGKRWYFFFSFSRGLILVHYHRYIFQASNRPRHIKTPNTNQLDHHRQVI